MSQKYITYFGYLGSKRRLLPALTTMFPNKKQNLYEVCGGSGIVSLNRSKSFDHTYYNEYDKDIVRLFKLMKNPDTQKDLIDRLINLPNSKVWFMECLNCYNNDFYDVSNEIEKAAITFTLLTQSFMYDRNSWFSRKKNTSLFNNKINYFTKKHELEEVASALQNIDVLNQDCFTLIPSIGDNSDNFILADIPYPLDTMTINDCYGDKCCWSNDRHLQFAKMVKNIKAKIMICCYSSNLYDEVLSQNPQWNKYFIKSLPSPNNRGKGRDKEEYVYINYSDLSSVIELYSVHINFFETIHSHNDKNR